VPANIAPGFNGPPPGDIAGWLLRGADRDHVVLGPVTHDRDNAAQFSFAVAVGKHGRRQLTTIEGAVDEGSADLDKLRRELRLALARRRGLMVHEAPTEAAMAKLCAELF
jgi:hypothetical protein